MKHFNGRVAIVTGGASGIGYAKRLTSADFTGQPY
jgi:NAD(P)-dependent dehydrogenase (short-subunit alcohol dehydrogenase family)